MNNFCHNDLVFSFSQIYQIIIIWNNQRNIFHHHSQNQAKEKRPFKTSLPLRQSNAHPSQQNAPVRLICARTGPILSQIYRPIKLMFKKSVQTPFKIKMQFNSIKLFARFVFLGWLFNFISNLLLFNQTDYVLLYTVFTHFVLPPLRKQPTQPNIFRLTVFLVIIQNSFFQCSLFRKGKSYVVEFKSANLLSSQHQSLRFFRIK